ncbi:MAG: hypothetical protein M1816_007565 [Peltula sp. TS41687]|nr:MAG: hypothetical protein M1816_007565 [Peltula sp. TS41687]
MSALPLISLLTPKIFVTGATGYVGGDGLYALVAAHPEYEKDITCLVRDSDKGALIASHYSKIRLVYGTLDDSDLLEAEAKEADIVLHWASSDHEEAARALTKGLAAHPPASPGYLIHTSGTGILCHADVERGAYGEASSKVYDDWEHVSELTSGMPDNAWHRSVDKIVLDAGAAHPDRVKTAIVSPPAIYGPGRGRGNKRSVQLYELASAILRRGKGFKVGKGKTMWNGVHVRDLSDVYVALVEHAVRGPLGKASWGADGYYFAETNEFSWGDVARRVTNAAYNQGLIGSDDVVSVSAEEANAILTGGAAMWGANSRCKAVRARKLLLWKPKGRDIVSEIADAVRREAKRLEILPGHAKKAAGKA